MEFVGLEGWYDDSIRTEIDTPSGLVDLHNNAIVREIKLKPKAAELILEFSYAEHWGKIESAGVPVRLTFGGLRDFRLTQEPDYDPDAAESLEGITQRREGSVSHFEVDLGDVQCLFIADRLELTAPTLFA